MNLFFDEMSQKLIVDAKKEMYELKHPYVGSEHLMLAILHSKLDITKLLNEFGITYDKFRDELIKVIGMGSKENEWFLFTPLLRRIINNATYYSKDNNKVVTPYNLLVSILQEGDGVANRILIGMNIDLYELCDRFLSNDLVVKSTPILDELGINMNKCAKSGKYDPLVGRDNQIERIIGTLIRKNKNNPLLIGEAGVGKTAIIEELARRISIGNVPNKLKNKTIYSISMSILVAGTKYRGEFEERFNKLIKEVVGNEDIILFIDEIHTLVGAGGAEGAIDASNIIKPYLARGDIKLIGATTMYEYSKFIEKDKALDRRFQKIYIEETMKDEVRSILFKLKDIYEKYHNVVIKKNIIELILNYSYTCVFNNRQPDRAIDLLDEVCSYAVIHGEDLEKSKLEIAINDVERTKNDEIIKHNFKKALSLKNKEMELRNNYNNLLLSNSNKKIIIDKDMVDEVIYKRNRINTNTDYSRLYDVLSKYNKESIEDLIATIKKYDYISNEKALLVALVNKSVLDNTFLVDKVVENIYYNHNYISINMNEYRDSSSINRLIGNDNSLFQSIKENPFTIIYMYNVENCNYSVLKTISDGIDKGYIINNRNERINISKCIMFMGVSNIENSIGFNNKLKDGNELLSKATEIIYFNSKSVLV